MERGLVVILSLTVLLPRCWQTETKNGYFRGGKENKDSPDIMLYCSEGKGTQI